MGMKKAGGVKRETCSGRTAGVSAVEDITLVPPGWMPGSTAGGTPAATLTGKFPFLHGRCDYLVAL
jgi:hypothetical protein